MPGFSSPPLLGLSRLRTHWMAIIAACVPAGLAIAVVAVACGGDSITGPGFCTGTCIAVSNQADVGVNEVYFRSCADADWGVNRLSGAIIRPDNEKEWPVDAGCWDILARSTLGSNACSKLENDVQVSSGERHVTAFGGCTNARARVGMPSS
jgi:hypothetical protein